MGGRSSQPCKGLYQHHYSTESFNFHHCSQPNISRKDTCTGTWGGFPKEGRAGIRTMATHGTELCSGMKAAPSCLPPQHPQLCHSSEMALAVTSIGCCSFGHHSCRQKEPQNPSNRRRTLLQPCTHPDRIKHCTVPLQPCVSHQHCDC